MASQNNGEGPPDGKGAGSRPGTYTKIAGARRRRGRRKHVTSTHPPASPAALAEPLELDPSSERDEEGGLDEPFDPPIDDLRNPRAAPRKAPGPLGMDEARRAIGGDSPVAIAPVRVVEIGGPPHGSDNSNDGHDDRLESVAPMVEPRLHHAPAQMDEPFAPPSAPPPPRKDDDRYADDAELRAASQRPPPREGQHEPEQGHVPAAQLVSQGAGSGFTMGAHAAPEEELEHESAQGVSTVFHARPSLRPSPPPPPRSALGWWVVIAVLSSIIVAALSVAVREEMEAREEPPYLVAPAAPSEHAMPPASAPAVEVPQPVVDPAPVPQPSAAIAADAGAQAAADAGLKAVSGPSATPKPARVWKPKPKPVAGDGGTLAAPSRSAPAPVEAAPVESVPANPYGRLQ